MTMAHRISLFKGIGMILNQHYSDVEPALNKKKDARINF